jgi:hypothetical protein
MEIKILGCGFLMDEEASVRGKVVVIRKQRPWPSRWRPPPKVRWFTRPVVVNEVGFNNSLWAILILP